MPFLLDIDGQEGLVATHIFHRQVLFFVAHYENTHVVDSWGYAGASFFDYVVTWFEFAPWFLYLLAGYARDRIVRTRKEN